MKTKKENNTTALALPSVQPKPTRKEVIDALVARAKVKHDAENERRQAMREQLEGKIKSAALKDFKSKAFKGTPSVYIQFHNNTVEIQYLVKSDTVTQLIAQYEKNRRVDWNENIVRQEIRDALDGRSPLLDNPEAVKAMDALLESWGF